MRKLMTIVLIGILGLTVAGTSFGQNNETPPNPLTVDEAVRIALRQNPSFLQTEAGITVAQGSRLSAISAMLPGVNGSLTWNASKTTNKVTDLPRTFVGGIPTDFFPDDFPLDSKSAGRSFSFGVSESISLQEWYWYRSSNADLHATELNVVDAAEQLVFTVRQQFYLSLRAEDLLTVQQEDLRLAEDELKRVNSMFEVGSVARADVMKGRVRVSEAELALIQQENAVEIELTRLAVLLGYRANSRIILEGDLQPRLSTQVDSTAAVDEAKDRALLNSARFNVQSANLSSKAANFYWLPSAFVDYNYSTFDGTSENDRLASQAVPPDTVRNAVVLDKNDLLRDGWSIRGGLSVNLDALLFWTGEQRRATGVKRQREYQLEDLELEVQRELEESILNLRASERSIGAAQDAVESAEEDLRLSRERYEQGLGTILELVEAQVALTRARNQLVNALTGLRISEAAYNRARGEKVWER